jgi:hypothetical protein
MPNFFVCYDFHYGISNEEKDVMFATKLDMFSIGIIAVPTHIEHVVKPVCLLDIGIAKPIQKQFVKMLGVLVIRLVIPPNIVKQHLPETFFRPKVGKMIIDETPTRK